MAKITSERLLSNTASSPIIRTGAESRTLANAYTNRHSGTAVLHTEIENPGHQPLLEVLEEVRSGLSELASNVSAIKYSDRASFDEKPLEERLKIKERVRKIIDGISNLAHWFENIGLGLKQSMTDSVIPLAGWVRDLKAEITE